ncbi:CvpA family protein [Capnocytophaga felis]|uniref:Colicin V production protein n=1 Tax=Capnocytophaga felis TaxID=2267611 RepID=A0A5M4B6C8_9FLAO|nr:CvpA family protein [Capnocytophaga felis]GET45173.1 hypothetical protein RCZ01_04750 [Capnocytophaga felis]GET47663.1 hypothetical protein RCZ02_04940 [Capnocytophaga felis]
MNTVDVILLIFLGFGLIRGLWRGVIVELASLLAIILGIYGAIHFSFYIAGILNQYFSLDKSTTEALSFAFTLILIMLAVMLLAKFLTTLAESVSLGFLNRLAGGIFGVLKIAVIAGTLFLVLEKTWQITKWIPEETLLNSKLYEPIKAIGNLFYANVF